VASLKIIRKRIGSVRNTQQVTKAMKMVAAAKLRKAQERTEHARAYSERLASILGRLAGGGEGEAAHPLLASGTDAPAHAIVIPADRGLCGAYNANVAKKAERFLAEAEGKGASITACGRRGRDYLSIRGYKLVTEHVNLASDMSVGLARDVASDAVRRFVSGEAGKVFLIYTKFHSAISHEPTLKQLLPVVPSTTEVGSEVEYVYEPSTAAILASLLPRYVDTVVFHAMLEATASEHGSRMTAMDSASRNAAEMIDKLTLQMNRARQAGITTELMEIVGGAEALKG
jgi:F-type H+-transporting ATPase subunit gamma